MVFHYNDDGDRDYVIDKRGAKTTFDYTKDEDGNITSISVTDPLSVV